MDSQKDRQGEQGEAHLLPQGNEAGSDEFQTHLPGCLTIQQGELIEAYLGHQLNEAVSDKFETHLLGCPGCTRLLEQMQSLHDGLEEKAPSIRSAVSKQRSFLLLWQTAAVAFALLLVLSVGLLQLRKGKKEPVAVAARPQPQPEVRVQEEPPASVPKSSAPQPQPEVAQVHRADKKPADQLHSDKSPSNEKVNAPAPRTVETIIAHSQPVETQTNGAKSTNTSSFLKQMPIGSRNELNFTLTTASLTTAQGVELFQIGAVEAPPFAFSGFGEHALDPKGGRTKSLSKGEPAPDTGRALFRQGMNAYLDGRYQDAIGFLQSAALKDNKSDDINFYLGVSQILAGHPQEAVIPLGKVIVPGKSALLQSAHYYLGKAYVQQLKLAEAETEFRAAAALPGRVTADSNSLLARTIALREQLKANDKPPSIP